MGWGAPMNAAELGWTLDDLHERIAACDALADGVAELDADSEDSWTDSASLTFLRLCDELLTLAKSAPLPVPATLLRRLKRLDQRLPNDEAARSAGRLRSWLVRQESDVASETELDTAPLGEPEAPSGDNLVTLPKGAGSGGEKERLRGLRTERWVAVPARVEVRRRAKAVRDALSGLALVLSAANAEEDAPFGTLDRKRFVLVLQATRATLAGPLVERGLLRAVMDNTAIIERRGGTRDLRSTAKRLRQTLEVFVSDLS